MRHAKALAGMVVFAFSCLATAHAYDKSMHEARYLYDVETNSCHYDCPAPTHFWFCFSVDGTALMGQTIAWFWQYDPTGMQQLRGHKVMLRYTKNNIWVIRTDGKELKLKRDESYLEFTQGCKAASAAQ